LKYIYSKLNRNMETAVTNAFGAAGGSVIIGGSSGGSPWSPLPVGNTNAGTGGIPVPGGGGTVFVPVFIPANTNAPGGGGPTVTNIPIGPIQTNAFIDPAIRGGIDKLNFIKVQYDSLLGRFIAPVLDSWADTIVTNGQQFPQGLQRIITDPDIIFSAGDIDGDGATAVHTALLRTANWVNQSTLNNGNGIVNAGPGTITPSVTITFNTVGPVIFHGIWPFNFPSEDTGTIGFSWGSFDGTTNAPVTYPNGTSIRDLENLVLGGQ
jgi:hypothetical protein